MNGPNLDGCGWINELLPVVRLLTPKIQRCHICSLFHPSLRLSCCHIIDEDYRFISPNPEDSRP